MQANPLNVPPVSIATVRDALAAQYADPLLRRRATMLWGARGVGKSSVVRQAAAQHGVPLVDLRLTTIEPVDLLDALYGLVYGLLAVSTDAPTLTRALEIVEALPEAPAAGKLPLREAQTLAMELMLQRALVQGLDGAVLASPAYQRHAARRREGGRG